MIRKWSKKIILVDVDAHWRNCRPFSEQRNVYLLRKKIVTVITYIYIYICREREGGGRNNMLGKPDKT